MPNSLQNFTLESHSKILFSLNAGEVGVDDVLFSLFTVVAEDDASTVVTSDEITALCCCCQEEHLAGTDTVADGGMKARAR